jgi:hypothetical protein
LLCAVFKLAADSDMTSPTTLGGADTRAPAPGDGLPVWIQPRQLPHTSARPHVSTSPTPPAAAATPLTRLLTTR